MNTPAALLRDKPPVTYSCSSPFTSVVRKCCCWVRPNNDPSGCDVISGSKERRGHGGVGGVGCAGYSRCAVLGVHARDFRQEVINETMSSVLWDDAEVAGASVVGATRGDDETDEVLVPVVCESPHFPIPREAFVEVKVVCGLGVGAKFSYPGLGVDVQGALSDLGEDVNEGVIIGWGERQALTPLRKGLVSCPGVTQPFDAVCQAS